MDCTEENSGMDRNSNRNRNSPISHYKQTKPDAFKDPEHSIQLSLDKIGMNYFGSLSTELYYHDR